MYTRRDAKSITNSASYVTNPRQVHTSAVKKSAPAIFTRAGPSERAVDDLAIGVRGRAITRAVDVLRRT